MGSTRLSGGHHPPGDTAMTRFALALAAALIALPAAAQPSHQGHGAHATRDVQDTAATREFRAANDRMHRDMAIRYTGDADRDFAAGMIPHHQGAIDMANIVLRHGTDPGMRALAQGIIRAQEAEIALLRAFLARTAPR
jgi:uncharacterized protein (DUF305 family)